MSVLEEIELDCKLFSLVALCSSFAEVWRGGEVAIVNEKDGFVFSLLLRLSLVFGTIALV